jgi:hypothetical protein
MRKMTLWIFYIFFLACIVYSEKIDYTLNPVQCNSEICTPLTFNSSDGKYFFKQNILPYTLICTDRCLNREISSKTNAVCNNKIDCLEYTKYYYTEQQLINLRNNFERNCLINISKQKAIITIDPNRNNQINIPEKRSFVDTKLISWLQFLMDLMANRIKIIS